MHDSDDPPSSTPPEPGGPLAPVIPLAGRARPTARVLSRPALPEEVQRLYTIAFPDRASPVPANDAEAEPAAPGDLGAERRDIERNIALTRRDIERGRRGADRRLLALRRLHAMNTFQRGDHKTAHHEWEELITADPSTPEDLLTRALFFSNSDDFDTALDDYARAAARFPHNPEVYRRRASCFVQLGDWERALADYRRLVHLRPRDTEALENFASALRFTGDHAGAIRILGRAIQLAPWRARLYESRAACYLVRDMPAEQRIDLDRCLQIDPRHAAALRARARIHHANKDYESELTDLQRAIEVEPGNASTYQSRAYCHRWRGENDLALADFTKAIELDPSELAYRDGRARLAMRTGAYELAIEDLDRIIRRTLQPDTEYFWLKGHALRKLGRLEEAVASYHRAIYRNAEHMEDLRWDIQHHRFANETAELLDCLDTWILLRPDSVDALMERAALHMQAGDLAKARADLERAKELEPDEE